LLSPEIVSEESSLMSMSPFALSTVIVSFVLLGHFQSAPVGSTYEPAHVENGKLIPGRVVP